MTHRVYGIYAWVPVALTQHLSWLVLGAVGALALAQRVVSEWQRRRTLVDVLKEAPLGSVIEQGAGMGGPKMRIRVGTGRRS